MTTLQAALYDESFETYPISIYSDDPTATGDAANFTVKLPSPLQLPNGPDSYVVMLQSCNFRHPGREPVYVACSLTGKRIEGSQATQDLVRIPPIQAEDELYSWTYTGSYPIWIPAAGSRFDTIEVQFALGDGSLIPVVAGDTSAITVLLRKVRLQ